MSGSRGITSTRVGATARAAVLLRRLLQQGGLYLNNERVSDPNRCCGPGDLADGRLAVLRSGRKSYRLVRLLPEA